MLIAHARRIIALRPATPFVELRTAASKLDLVLFVGDV